MPDRTAALEERSALIERLSRMPAAMRERPQWLLWKLEHHEGEAKARKVPYYASGRRRGGTRDQPLAQGSDADRAALAAFDVCIERLKGGLHFAGLGFAFLPGDGLVGIDIDGAIDPESGEVSELCESLIRMCDSFTERSPSGRGVHIIAAGETASFKDNGIGLEVFCGSQFFTCTGAWWPGSPADVRSVDADVLAYMRSLVDESKARAKAAKVVPIAAAAAPQPAAPRPQPAWGEGVDDFKRVNVAALQALDAWVPELFPSARRSSIGYRVTSKDLGRDLQEDLSITTEGIMDFGLEQGFTPVDLVLKWHVSMPRPKDALHWLASRIGLEVRRPRLQLASAAPGADPRPDPPPPPHENDRPTRRRRRGGASGNANPPDNGVGGGFQRLRDSFRLIYGTDAVWDGEQRITMAVKNLRLLFGNDVVKMWLASEDRRVVMQHDMVFEPGLEIEEHQVNLFDGLPTEPVPCGEEDVAVMIELLHHLCSKSAPTEEGIQAVVHWVLCWLAYPLQNVGAKMRTALVFHGPQGTGKNLFFDCYRAMFGKYGRMVGQTELDDKFNDWLSAKLLIVGNEVVTRQELFHNKNKLKWIVTEDEIPIRGMHQTVRWESNHANVVFLSNESQPIALEKDDRRHVVIYTPTASDESLYLRVAEFLHQREGVAKFMYYLHGYALGSFGEHTKPIMTEAKQALIELSLKPAERFVNEWLQGLLPLPVMVCSAEQLYRVFRRWCDQTGERFPPPQAQFTKTCERHVIERVARDPETGQRLPPKLTYKVVALKHEVGPRKAVRCWLPRGTSPADGISEGEWAADCVASFESSVARYGRASHLEDGE